MNICIKSNSSKKFASIIGDNLHKFNKSKCEWISKNSNIEVKYHNFSVYDNEKLVGGAIGSIKFGWYFLDELWIDENYRKNGIGTMLIKKIEEYATENKAIGVRMETWNFQARGFYEKMGYKVYATFEDCPPGTTDYFLRKKL